LKDKSKPTVINNVETLAYAAMIIKDGPETFRSLGTKDSAGGKVFSVSGDTEKRGRVELPMGMSLGSSWNCSAMMTPRRYRWADSSGAFVPRKKFASTIIGFEGVPTGAR
jgi:hypothetical protein